MKNCIVGVLQTTLYLHHTIDKYKFMYMYLYECYVLNEKWINEIIFISSDEWVNCVWVGLLDDLSIHFKWYENLYQHCSIIIIIIRGVLGKIIIKSNKYSCLLTIGCRRYAPTVKVSSEGYSSECFSLESGDVNLKQPLYFSEFYEPSVCICSITCRNQKQNFQPFENSSCGIS